MFKVNISMILLIAYLASYDFNDPEKTVLKADVKLSLNRNPVMNEKVAVTIRDYTFWRKNHISFILAFLGLKINVLVFLLLCTVHSPFDSFDSVEYEWITVDLEPIILQSSLIFRNVPLDI